MVVQIALFSRFRSSRAPQSLPLLALAALLPVLWPWTVCAQSAGDPAVTASGSAAPGASSTPAPLAASAAAAQAGRPASPATAGPAAESLPAGAAAAAQGAPPRQLPAPTATSAVLPGWLQFHGSQRTRYETMDHRYGPREDGSDQQLAFRTRFAVQTNHPVFWSYSELEDARVSLADSASTLTASHATGVKVLQMYAGARRRNLWGAGLTVQLEVGRFSRDFGDRRVLARQVDRNATSAFDGAIGRVSGKTWAVQGLYLRPRVYTYPTYGVDERFRGLNVGGAYVTTTRLRWLQGDLYLLRLRDGDGALASQHRRMTIPGARLLGSLGAAGVWDFEVETVGQFGTVGDLPHRAGFIHAQATHTWKRWPWRPRLFAMYDYASGDADPTDRRSGTYDALFGARRFELGPSGIYLLVARTNINSPALQLLLRPTSSVDLTVQQRRVWLASARDRWRSSNLGDPTGAAGSDIGWQTDVRLRYRWRQYFEFDGAVVYLNEGAFPQRLKPSPGGHTTFLTTALEVHF